MATVCLESNQAIYMQRIRTQNTVRRSTQTASDDIVSNDEKKKKNPKRQSGRFVGGV